MAKPVIDDQHYADGRADFEAGKSLRSIAEHLFQAADTGNDLAIGNAVSRAVGFTDALLDQFRT